MSNIDYTTLASHLAAIPDPRSRRGQRYAWHYLLILIAAAMLTGRSTLTLISDWVQGNQDELFDALQPVVTPAVWKGKDAVVKIGSVQSIVVAVPAGSAAKIKTQVARADPLVAPFTKGQQLAMLKVSVGEQPLIDVPLVALDAVEQAGILGRTWDAIRLWIK